MQTRSAARQKAILEAALACFDEHGYALTSIQQIRERSGASVGSIYHHFRDKEGIAAALYLDGITAYQRAILAALGDDTAEGIRRAVAAHVTWSESRPALSRFLDTKREFEVAMVTEGGLQEANAAFLRELRAWIKPRADSGELADLPLELFLAILIGPAQMFMRRKLAGGGRGTSTRGARLALGDAAWAALAGPGSPR